jgi:pilus assembly protein Flp/PilA
MVEGRSSHLMSKTLSRLKGFLRCPSGATAIEYALIAGGVSIVIVGAVALLGDAVTNLFNSVVAALGG